MRPAKAWRPEHDSGQKRPLEEVIAEQRPELGEEGRTGRNTEGLGGHFPAARGGGPEACGGMQSEGLAHLS